MDLELLKTFAQTEKTLEDIDLIMSMTQGLPFVISYNNAEIHKLICQNMKMGTYQAEQTIYDSSLQDNIDFLIFSGEVSLYSEENQNLSLIREMGTKDCFGRFELDIMKKNSTKISKIIAKAKSLCKIIIFENKVDQKAPVPKTKREVFLTQRELLKGKFDPEIFIFDNPEKISMIIDEIKEKIVDEFDTTNTYDDVLGKLKSEKEFSEISNVFKGKRNINEILNYIEGRYGTDYTDESVLDLKLGMIAEKCVEPIQPAKSSIMTSLDQLKIKFYDKNNHKNRNLIQLNIENELEKDEFNDYIYNEISKTKNLEQLKEKKKKNDTKIEQNKKSIKKDENLLLNTYYCIYCHVRPRDAISTNCNHLVICEECMKKTKICPRCGVNIDNYHKIYRS